MPLGPDRILMEGESPHPWEREAMAFIKKELPGGDPYLAALQVDLHDPTGKLHQLDAVLLGYHALYIVEVKSHPGTLDGDYADWKVTFPDGKVTVFDNPLSATAHKAKVLASMLQKLIPDPAKRPWVEPLVFLSDKSLVVRLGDNYRGGVVTVRDFAKAITFGEVPLASERLRRNVVNRPTMRAVAEALKKCLSPSRPGLSWGEFQLRKVMEEGPGYQDWAAEHGSNREMRRRVRVYPVPPSSTPERRDQLRRAAEREANLLSVLDHRSVLRALDYAPRGPTGAPAVAFDAFDGAETLDAFVRRHPELSFAQRVELVERLAEALAYCHGKRVFHRGLYPGAVLVRLQPNGTPEVKLYNFQLATRADSSIGTVHFSTFLTDPAMLYRAPEAIENPEKAETVEADLFSLGAIAYFVLTGRQPGADLPERHALLGREGLSVAAASDALAGDASSEDVKSLDEVVRYATNPSPLTRADDVLTWLNLFSDAASRPDPAPVEEESDPLEAGKDASLGAGLVVEALLGSGSTARVLRVRRGEQVFALKVPLSPDLEERLVGEAEALRRAKCDRVVPLEGEPVLKGRHCLLVGYAGETVAGLLAREGPPSLDYARRWGDDLLYALSVLEERGVLHRDVKPANLGVLPGEAKKARHLFLFDFSLASADPARIELGTPAYRDPFLATRPGARWDSASDRFSAALTLHELLTGVLPRYGSGEAAAAVTDGEVRLAAERFDASVRDRLVAFFRKALDRDVSHRHESAEEMRTHWAACFGPAQARGDETRPELDDAALAALALDTPVPSLPVSPAAKNALDRSGVVLVRELLDLPRNQLSSIRGVGRGTVREILAFVERYRRVRTVDEVAAAPFWPGYRGADGGADEALPPEPATALDDAGLGRLHVAAAAAKDRVERILSRFPGARETFAAFLEKEQRKATGAPATVEGFIDLFLPGQRGKKEAAAWSRQVRAFYGLDVLPGATPGDARSVAAVLGVTRQSIYVSIARGRVKWRARADQLVAVQRMIGDALASLGGIAPLSRLGEAVASILPHEPGQEADPLASARVEALIRVCAEASDTEATEQAAGAEAPADAQAKPQAALHLERVGPSLWAATSSEHLQAARALGTAASDLARQEPLASSAEVERRLGEVVRASPLATLPADRLVSLAAEASDVAARSARLELYPKGMAATRALRLCAGAIGAEVTFEDVVRLVATRYPDAEPLPARPALDGLLAELKLGWNPERGRYVRADLVQPPSKTEALSPRKSTIAVPTVRPNRSPEEQEAEDFERTLRLAIEWRHFKVLDVNRAQAEDAAHELETRLGVPVRSLERELIDAAWKLMAANGVDERAVIEADRAGPQGPAWGLLVQLMRRAADEVAPSLLQGGRPVVIKDPGIAARYGLEALLEKLVRAAQDDGAPAILLLNPVVSDDGPQPIDALTSPLPIPTTAPAQRLRIPASWIQNRHRGEA